MRIKGSKVVKGRVIIEIFRKIWNNERDKV